MGGRTTGRPNVKLRDLRVHKGWGRPDLAAKLQLVAFELGEPDPPVDDNLVGKWERGEIDRACAALTASLAVAQTGGLQMTIQRVAGVRRSSLRDSTNPAVKRLDEGLLDVLAGE